MAHTPEDGHEGTKTEAVVSGVYSTNKKYQANSLLLPCTCTHPKCKCKTETLRLEGRGEFLTLEQKTFLMLARIHSVMKEKMETFHSTNWGKCFNVAKRSVKAN